MTDTTDFILATLDRCREIKDLLLSRGFASAYCDVTVSTDAFSHALKAVGRDTNGEATYFNADFDTHSLDEAFDAVRAQIEAAPSIHELRRERLARRTAQLVEEARDLGLDDAAATAFINPLERAMQALSENAIAGVRHAAE